MAERPVGTDMDALGVTLDLDEGDVIEQMVVIATVRGAVSGRHLYTGVSSAVDWMDQYMMIKLAGKFCLDDD